MSEQNLPTLEISIQNRYVKIHVDFKNAKTQIIHNCSSEDIVLKYLENAVKYIKKT